jgi:hypothetical protein
VPYLTCPACSLTIPEPPGLFAPRTCARCRLVKGERVVLERVELRPEAPDGEPSDEPDQAGAT